MRPPSRRVLLLTAALWPAAAGAELTAGGRLEALGRLALDADAGGDRVRCAVRARPHATWLVSESLLLRAEADLRGDSAGVYTGVVADPAGRNEERPAVDVREAYAEWNAGAVRLRAGKQVFDWSVTDTVSASDNLAPRDWTDLAEWERLGVPAVDLRLGYDAYVEAAFVPLFSPSRLPSEAAGYARLDARGLPAAEPDLPEGSSAALRAGFAWRGFDLAAGYYGGYSVSPSYEPRFAPPGVPEIVPVYRREEVWSGAVAGALGAYNLRAEAGYFRQEEEDDFVLYAAGLDREWGGVVAGADTLYALLQYAGERTTDPGDAAPGRRLDFRRSLCPGLLGRLKYAPDAAGGWALEAEAAYNLDDGDGYLEPSVAWRGGNLEWQAGLSVFSGPAESALGAYRRSDRVFLRLAYSL